MHAWPFENSAYVQTFYINIDLYLHVALQTFGYR